MKKKRLNQIKAKQTQQLSRDMQRMYQGFIAGQKKVSFFKRQKLALSIAYGVPLKYKFLGLSSAAGRVSGKIHSLKGSSAFFKAIVCRWANIAKSRTTDGPKTRPHKRPILSIYSAVNQTDGTTDGTPKESKTKHQTIQQKDTRKTHLRRIRRIRRLLIVLQRHRR